MERTELWALLLIAELGHFSSSGLIPSVVDYAMDGDCPWEAHPRRGRPRLVVAPGRQLCAPCQQKPKVLAMEEAVESHFAGLECHCHLYLVLDLAWAWTLSFQICLTRSCRLSQGLSSWHQPERKSFLGCLTLPLGFLIAVHGMNARTPWCRTCRGTDMLEGLPQTYQAR